MNSLYRVFSLLIFSALCLNVNPAKAGVCFVVGGDCGETDQVREDKNCLDLGYKYVTDADCVNDNPMYAVVDKDSASCVQGRVTYYKSCMCDTSKYKWKSGETGSNYDVLSSPKCHDSYGDHYQYRKCDTSVYNKLKETDVRNQSASCKIYAGGRVCNINAIPTDACNEDPDYLSYLSEKGVSDDKCKAEVSKRYKKCVCNTSTYKYKDSSSAAAFVVDGVPCIGEASDRSKVIDISGKIGGLFTGELTLYSGIKCSGKASGLGTWQKESCGDGYKETRTTTLDKLTCRVCEPDPCDVGYTYASGATECSTLFGAGMQCVQKAPKNSSFTGVCLKKATCDDLGSVNLVGGTYVGTASISSSNAAVSGYSSPSSTYDGTSLVYHAKSGVSITGMAEPQGLTVSKNGNEAISLSFNDQTCYWSKRDECSAKGPLWECPNNTSCITSYDGSRYCYKVATCDDAEATLLRGETKEYKNVKLCSTREACKVNSTDNVTSYYGDRDATYHYQINVKGNGSRLTSNTGNQMEIRLNGKTCYWNRSREKFADEWFTISVLYSGCGCCQDDGGHVFYDLVGGNDYKEVVKHANIGQLNPDWDEFWISPTAFEKMKGIFKNGLCLVPEGSDDVYGIMHVYIYKGSNKQANPFDVCPNEVECTNVKYENGKTYYKEGVWNVWKVEYGRNMVTPGTYKECASGYRRGWVNTNEYGSKRFCVSEENGPDPRKEFCTGYGGTVNNYNFRGGYHYTIRIQCGKTSYY